MADVEPALATIIFTDQVGSTATRTMLGEEQADALKRVHHELLGMCVEQHGGRLVKSTGDGIMATFESAGQGLTAAIEMQKAVARYRNRNDAIADLHIRVGLSVGDVAWADDDCSGTPVVEAARLEAAADTDQILCSDLVKIMARGRGGLEFASVGELELKGLGEPLAASEVVWRADEADGETALPREIRSLLGSTFAGRVDELAGIVGRLISSEGDQPTAIWLLGEPGIGKSRLAAETSALAAERGARILFGRCSEDLDVTYQPFIEVFRAAAARITDAELVVEFGRGAAELSRLLPALGDRMPGLEPPVSSTPELEQFRLFEAVREWLAEAASRQPVVVVLDDLHWGNRPTIALVSHLLRSGGPGALSVVVTARSTAPDGNEHLSTLIDQMARIPTSEVFELDGLSDEEVGQLVGDHGAAREIHTATAGNPLMVTSVLDARSRGESGLADISSTVRSRVKALPDPVQQVLAYASLCELAFDSRVLARALDRDDMEVLDELDVAVDSNLVEETGVDAYRFEHGLVRAALRDDIRQSRRSRMHLRIARAIEEVHSSRLDDHVAELAFHYYAAAGGEGDENALAYLVRAAELAVVALALDEAENHYRKALEVVGDDHRRRYELLMALARVQRRGGHNLPAALSFDEAVRAAEQIADGRLAMRAAIEYEDTTWRSGVFATDPLTVLERVGAAHRADLDADDLGLQARIDAATGRALCFNGRVEEGSPLLERAVETARRSGDPADLGHALAAQCIGDIRPESSSTVLEAAAELIALSEHLADEEVEIHGRQFELRELVVQGEIERYRRRLPEFVGITDEVRSPFWRYVAQQHVAMLAFQDGRLADATAEAERAVEIADDLPGEDPSGIYGQRMFAIRREQDQLRVVGPLLARMLGRESAGAIWLPGLAVLHAELDQHDDAREVFDSLAEDRFAAIPRDGSWPLSLGFLAETCAYLGDQRRARELYEELGSYAGLSLIGGLFVLSFGSADRFLGRLAATMGELDLASRHLGTAVAHNRRIQSPLWEGHALADLGVLAAAQGDPAAAEEAAGVVGELARDHDLPLLMRRAADLARGDT